jgi:hypothetical protein
MERERSIANVDESLAVRVATFTRGGQRWLKTALQAIATSDLLEDAEAPAVDETEPAAREQAEIAEAPPAERAASLEDVITGKADLRDHLESYPELQDELEGLADVIDLLREAGETRRKRGEQILRDEILGEQGQEKVEPEDEGEVI